MSLSLTDIVEDISFGKITDIDIWNKLIHYFSEQWDGQPEFIAVLNLSGRQLGEQIKNVTDTYTYFNALENTFSDNNDLLEFLINLTGYLNYHTESGSVNVKHSLKELRKNLKHLRQQCVRRGMFHDRNFVGREVQIKTMEDKIKTGSILLCGLGGMGKTSLANTVCYRLRGECWKTIKIELREQVTYRHFLRTSVQSIMKGSNVLVSGSQSSDNDQNGEKTDQILIEELNLRQKLLEHITEKLRRKLIFLFDNLDDETTEDACATHSSIEQSKIMEFFKSLLEIMTANKDCQTRLIITSRNNFLLTTGKELRNLVKIEVDSLGIEDARKLTVKCTKQCTLNDQQIDAIVTVCCACPLAIRVISDVINDSPNGIQIVSLIQKSTDTFLSPLLQIYECLSQPFEKLKEYKSTLGQLSLFGTTKFDMNSAANIVFGKFQTNMEKKEIIKKLTELKLTLLLFKSRHLIEIENEECSYSPGCQNTDMELDDLFIGQKIYSLHPLVYKFLKEKVNDKELIGDIRIAKYNYIVFFDELVLDIGQESNVLIAREKSEKIKIHILKYIEFMKEYKSFSDIPHLQKLSTPEDAKRRNKVVQMICIPEYHLSFIESMLSKVDNNVVAKLSWEIEYVAAIVRYQHFCDNIEDRCKLILQELNSVASNTLSEMENIQLSILKGRTCFFLGTITTDSDPGYSEKCLLEGKHIFESQQLRQKARSFIIFI
ncbi:unnamed protein product [Mytilus coruscus]|uniref:ATPase AAA-type core domain-containing protein n=1 Tax=Mytilus coruscus TaxID=42192 RepID=A0A6J8BYN0_MYTCO|nr:unnamed protein product [Mytilus coruscus]